MRVRDLLERFLPAPPATVLDVGGAAGRYAIPLAAGGYEVRLIDPVPLYHLTSRDDRVTALSEARRAARPGGVVVAVGLSRFYPLFENLAADAMPGLFDNAARCVADGQYRNPDGDVTGCTTSYFHRLEDLVGEVADAGLDLEKLAGANGIAKLAPPDLSDRLDDDSQRGRITGLLRLVESEPSILGLSQNLVAIAWA